MYLPKWRRGASRRESERAVRKKGASDNPCVTQSGPLYVFVAPAASARPGPDFRPLCHRLTACVSSSRRRKYGKSCVRERFSELLNPIDFCVSIRSLWLAGSDGRRESAAPNLMNLCSGDKERPKGAAALKYYLLSVTFLPPARIVSLRAPREVKDGIYLCVSRAHLSFYCRSYLRFSAACRVNKHCQCCAVAK